MTTGTKVPTVSKAEAVRRLGVSRSAVNYLIKQGHLRLHNGRVTLESVEARLRTHGSKSQFRFASNTDVVEWFTRYLQSEGLTPTRVVTDPLSGATGEDFRLDVDGRTFFVEAIGSNPSRPTQSSAFRAAFQGAISRISDPTRDVPVILMPARERLGMSQRARSWGELAWKKCFDWFEFWFIRQEQDGRIVVEKTRALDFISSNSILAEGVTPNMLCNNNAHDIRARIMWDYMEQHPEGVTVADLHRLCLERGLTFNPRPRGSGNETARRQRIAISSQLGYWRRKGKVEKISVPGTAACIWRIKKQ